MINTIKNLSKFEVLLWLVSAVSVTTAFLISGGFGVLTLAASLVGVTSLIFLAKGDVTGQVLMVIFSVLYAIISYGQKYYGEMITYMGMTAPIAVLSIITWLRNPYGKNQVKIRQLSVWGFAALAAVTGAVTAVFYFILFYIKGMRKCELVFQYCFRGNKLFCSESYYAEKQVLRCGIRM